jgi:glutamate-1-semialdehyde 2,1-aminomutase
MKVHGIETSTSGNCFLTTAHTEEDGRAVVEATKKSIGIMLEHGFFLEPEPVSASEAAVAAPATAPTQAAAPVAAQAPASAARQSDPAAVVERLKALILADLNNAQGRGA